MRKSTFKKHIDQLSDEELKAELTLLYDKLPEVKNFYKMELGNAKEKEKYYAAAKKSIASKYATKSYRKPRRPRIQKVNKILRELKKQVIFDFEMIDIYLFTVETAVTFMHDYYFQSVPLYNNITNSFSLACALIAENRMESEYKERCETILQKTKYFRGLGQELQSSYEDMLN